MGDYSELKRLAEAANGCWHGTQQFIEFKEAVTPVVLMDLIADAELRGEVEMLREALELSRGTREIEAHSHELRAQIIEKLEEQVGMLKENAEMLRKDAERFRFVTDCPIRTHVALSRLSSAVDDFDLASECDRLMVMSKGEQS